MRREDEPSAPIRRTNLLLQKWSQLEVSLANADESDGSASIVPPPVLLSASSGAPFVSSCASAVSINDTHRLLAWLCLASCGASTHSSNSGLIAQLFVLDESSIDLASQDKQRTTQLVYSYQWEVHGTHAGLVSSYQMQWSPNGQVLVVTGPSGEAQVKLSESNNNNSQQGMWLFTWQEPWSYQLSGALELPKTTVLQLPLGELLKQCAKAARFLDGRDCECAQVFFPFDNKSNQVFVLLTTSVLVRIEFQLIKLWLSSPDELIAQWKQFVEVSVVQKMDQWHGNCITCSCFDNDSKTLVVAGSVKNPSDQLIKSGASSLSVWKIQPVTPTNEDSSCCELLDYTMVLTRREPVDNKHGDPLSANSADNDDRTSSESDQIDEIKGDSGWYTYFLELVGLGNAIPRDRMLKGHLCQLIMSPQGQNLVMIDTQGRISIRQIDMCAEVLPWLDLGPILLNQPTVDSRDDMSKDTFGTSSIQEATWVDTRHLVIAMTNGAVTHWSLTQAEHEQEAAAIVEESTCQLDFIHATTYQHHNHGSDGQFQESSKVKQNVWPCGFLASSSPNRSLKYSELDFVSYGSGKRSFSWRVSHVDEASPRELLSALLQAHEYSQALLLVSSSSESELTVSDRDEVFKHLWIDFCERHGGAAQIASTDSERERSAINKWVLSYDNESAVFEKALKWLNQVHDRLWIVDQATKVICCSFFDMKSLLKSGERALLEIEDEPDHAQARWLRKKLLKALYRLETFKLFLLEECQQADSATNNRLDDDVEVDQVYDAELFEYFRDTSILEMARKLALDNRLNALGILFERNAYNLLPNRQEILNLLPASTHPMSYAHLLPALPDSVLELRSGADSIQAFSLRQDDGPVDVVSIPLTKENRSCDTSEEELALFEQEFGCDRFTMAKRFAAWFDCRIRALDRDFGQLEHAQQLSILARKCLSQELNDMKVLASTREIAALVETIRESEKLFKCVYEFAVFNGQESGTSNEENAIHGGPSTATISTLTLDEWSAMSMGDQLELLLVNSGIKDSKRILEMVQSVFLSTRGSAFGLFDHEFAEFCVKKAREQSLSNLSLVALLVYQSNPSIACEQRLIQSDPVLLKTAVECILAVQQPGAAQEEHTAVIDQLWLVFQALPTRTPHDPPEIAALQVVVDEIEDLMVAMEVLTKYGIRVLPSILRRLKQEANLVARLDEYLEQMCQVTFGTSVLDSTAQFTKTDVIDQEGQDQQWQDQQRQGQQWILVWRDCLELKRHLFGADMRLDMMLEGIVRHLLAAGRYDEAKEVLQNTPKLLGQEGHIGDGRNGGLSIVLGAIRDSTNAASSGFDAQHIDISWKCIDLAQELLPSSDTQATSSSESTVDEVEVSFQKQIEAERNLIRASQLLEKLIGRSSSESPGDEEDIERSSWAVPLKLRLLGRKDRVQLILNVLKWNPANYRASSLMDFVFEANLIVPKQNQSTMKPLEVVLVLSELLEVLDQSTRDRIRLQGAYAAIYCGDYHAAMDLALELVLESVQHTENAATGEAKHGILSLAVDLVSASACSWKQKLTLCRRVIASDELMQEEEATITSADSSDEAELVLSDVLLKAMWRLEIVEDLANELGITERDMERMKASEELGLSQKTDETVLLSQVQLLFDVSSTGVSLSVPKDHNEQEQAFEWRVLLKAFRLISFEAKDKKECKAKWKEQTYRLSELCFSKALQRMRSGSIADSSPTADAVSMTTSRDWMQLAFGFLSVLDDTTLQQKLFSILLVEEATTCDDVSEKFSGSQEKQLSAIKRCLARQFQHFFLLEAVKVHLQAQGITPSHTQPFWSSLQATRQFIAQLDLDKTELSESASEMGDLLGTLDVHSVLLNQLTDPDDAAKCELYLALAKQSDQLMVNSQAQDELHELAALFNEQLDLERFQQDTNYQQETVLRLAFEQKLELARQFATKYQVDEYLCVLHFLKGVFLAFDGCTQTAFARQEQLEKAFRNVEEHRDILEEALQQPKRLAEFLLTDHTGLYDVVDGRDHVGMLLLFRMLLECSKRHGASTPPASSSGVVEEEVGSASFLPFSKETVDHLTLLFMCLKRIKEMENLAVDFKQVAGASKACLLLKKDSGTESKEDEEHKFQAKAQAIKAILPALNAKSIRMLSKILQRLHQISSSTLLMVFLDEMMAHMANQASGSAYLGTDADNRMITDDDDLVVADPAEWQQELAACAYESCVPFLSVLSLPHLFVFSWLLMGKATPREVDRSWFQSVRLMTRSLETPGPFDGLDDVVASGEPLKVAQWLERVFYGHKMRGMLLMGQFLTTSKRCEVLCDVLSLFDSKLVALEQTLPGDRDSSVVQDTEWYREMSGLLKCELGKSGLWKLWEMIPRSSLPSQDCDQVDCLVKRLLTSDTEWQTSGHVVEVIVQVVIGLADWQLGGFFGYLVELVWNVKRCLSEQPATDSEETSLMDQVATKVVDQLIDEFVQAVSVSTSTWVNCFGLLTSSSVDSETALEVLPTYGQLLKEKSMLERFLDHIASSEEAALERITTFKASLKEELTLLASTAHSSSLADPMLFKKRVMEAIACKVQEFEGVGDNHMPMAKQQQEHSARLIQATCLLEVVNSRLVTSSDGTAVVTDDESNATRRRLFGLYIKTAWSCLQHHKNSKLRHQLSATACISSCSTEDKTRRKSISESDFETLSSTISETLAMIPSEQMSGVFESRLGDLLVKWLQASSVDSIKLPVSWLKRQSLVMARVILEYQQIWGSLQLSTWHKKLDHMGCSIVAKQFDIDLREESALVGAQQQSMASSGWNCTLLEELWAALFCYGKWGDRSEMLRCYKQFGYDYITEETLQQTVLPQLLAQEDDRQVVLGLKLALYSPFESVLDNPEFVSKLESKITRTPSLLDQELAELIKLRFPLATWMQMMLQSQGDSVEVHNLVVPKPNSKCVVQGFASSVEYLICGLVQQGELSWAGRLVCGHLRVSRLLWNHETSQLVLMNFVKRLLSLEQQLDANTALSMTCQQQRRLRRAVYEKTWQRLQQAEQ